MQCQTRFTQQKKIKNSRVSAEELRLRFACNKVAGKSSQGYEVSQSLNPGCTLPVAKQK